MESLIPVPVPKGLVVKMAQTLWRASQDSCPSRYPKKICEGTGPEASRDRVGHFSPVALSRQLAEVSVFGIVKKPTGDV
ncbi:hypothetical protein D3C75_1253020 [compost metagenome]